MNPSFIESFQKTQNHLKDIQSILDDYMLEVEDKVIESIDEDQIVYNIDQLESLNNPKAYLYQLLKEYNFTDWTQIASSFRSAIWKANFIINPSFTEK